MAIIPQISMFVWENDIKNLGDLTRLELVLINIPDERLMRKLEKKRQNGRNDFPVRAMWNLVMAMVVFGHPKFSGVLRELARNVQLRYICGFMNGKIPSPVNMSRFVSNLKKEKKAIRRIFEELVGQLYIEIPDFGKDVALDSKWIWSMANGLSKRKNTDGRSEHDASWGVKEYSGIREDGSVWSKTERCFGFKLHTLVDANYELPIAYSVGRASEPDIIAGKALMSGLQEEKPDIIVKCAHFTADRGYDDKDFIKMLKGMGIKAVIDKRDMWRTEPERPLPGYERMYYDEHGEVYCYSAEAGERHRMIPSGYESSRDALRMRCPVKAYGAACSEAETCTLCKTIRVPLTTEERIFTQIARPSYKWERLYKKRTSVERVFSRLDVSFGFETRRVRGMDKMELTGALGLIVMNAMALGRIRQNKPDLMRSLTQAA